MARNKQVNPNKIGFGKFMAWNSRGASLAVQVVLISYVQIYSTNALGLNAAIVGTLLLVSKLIDGVTDMVAGYLVDRTNTKLGRGRPYELAIIGVWLSTWLMFSAPASISTVAKYVWVVVFYVLAQAIFATLLNANQNVYMVRAFHNDQKYVTITSIGGLVVTFCVIVFNVVFPTLEAPIINSGAGWSRLVLYISILMGVIGILRFIFVKEEVALDADTEKISPKDIVSLLRNNKNVYVLAFMMIVVNLIGSMGVSTYYYLYIVGDVSVMGLMSLFSVVSMLSMAVYPALLKKMSPKQLVIIGCVCAVIGGLINFFAYDNLVLLAIGSVIGGIGLLPINYMTGLFVIECADYNEWKNRPRMEGTLSSVVSLAGKVGSALGSFILGVMLSAAHFDGMAATQPDSALLMIRILFGLATSVFYGSIIFVMRFYRLDKLKGQISADLAERHALAEQAVNAE